MLYFRVKFEANNEPMYLGTRRGIEMWSAYAGGELFTETEVKNNSLNYDFLIPVNVNQRKTRMMGPYRVPTDDASITPWDYTADRRYDRFRPQPTMTIVHGRRLSRSGWLLCITARLPVILLPRGGFAVVRIAVVARMVLRCRR